MERSTYKDAQLECCPGGCVRDIKDWTMLYLTQILRVIHIHAGTNNLRRSCEEGQRTMEVTENVKLSIPMLVCC